MLDLSHFKHWLDMTWDPSEPSMAEQLSSFSVNTSVGPRRMLHEEIEPRHEAIAASTQAAFEESAFYVLTQLPASNESRVALPSRRMRHDSVKNGKNKLAHAVLKKCPFSPAPADGGTALSADQVP